MTLRSLAAALLASACASMDEGPAAAAQQVGPASTATVAAADAEFTSVTAACDDLAQVDINARMMIISPAVDEGGHSSLRLVNAFKTSLKREVADTADWSAKESLDFNEIWDVLLLNVKWRRELQELEQGG